MEPSHRKIDPYLEMTTAHDKNRDTLIIVTESPEIVSRLLSSPYEEGKCIRLLFLLH
jgi:hypothetical protein